MGNVAPVAELEPVPLPVQPTVAVRPQPSARADTFKDMALSNIVVSVCKDGAVYGQKSETTGHGREAERPLNPGDAILHLDRMHPNMYLANIVGAENTICADDDAAVFSIMDGQSIGRLGRLHTQHGRRCEHRSVPALDANIDAMQFYKTFYRAARQIAASIDRKDTVVHCQAGMNRSLTACIFFTILRAHDPAAPPDFVHRFGRGTHFDLKAVIDYARHVNQVGRYPVLTNQVFVALIKHAEVFEYVLHRPQNADLLRKRTMGRLENVARAFAAFVEHRQRTDTREYRRRSAR